MIENSTQDHDADCECLRCTAGRNAEEALAQREGWGDPLCQKCGESIPPDIYQQHLRFCDGSIVVEP